MKNFPQMIHQFAIGFFLLGLFFLVIIKNLQPTTAEHFSLQAQSFLNGQLHLAETDKIIMAHDTVLVDGKYYWPLGPLPSFLLVPLVGFSQACCGVVFQQGYLNIILITATFLLTYKIILHHRFDHLDAVFLATYFVFGSTLLMPALNQQSWYLSHNVSIFFTVLAYFIHQRKNNYVFVGWSYFAIFLTRLTAGFSVVYYYLEILLAPKTTRQKMKEVIHLSLPLFLAGIVLSGLNLVRFGNPFDFGYDQALNIGQIQENQRQGFGLFSYQNILSNVYIYFLYPPEPVFVQGTYHLVDPFFIPSPIGLGLFWLSPLYLRLFFVPIKVSKRRGAQLLLTITVVMLFLLSYYASGYWTFGPRYLNDIIFFMFLVLLASFKNQRLSLGYKFIILSSILCNLYLYQQLENNKLSNQMFYQKHLQQHGQIHP